MTTSTTVEETTILLDVHDDVCVDIEDNHNELTEAEKPLIHTGHPPHETASTPHRSSALSIHSICKPASVQKDERTVNSSVLRHEDTTQDEDVHFLVGSDRQLMTGRRLQMAALSPVFQAMLLGPWQEQDQIPVPDVQPTAFAAILRYAENGRTNPELDLTDKSVWDILKTADKYDVGSLVDACFSFLMEKHPNRKRSHHLCVVLEMAHRLNYTHHHTKLLHKVKQKAARVLRNQDAVGELCHQCMLDVVRADDLVGVDEIVVHDAVMTWTRCECERQGRQVDSWEELRDVAGDLVKHVRYLTLSKRTLTNLRAGNPSSCLLTQEELEGLRKGHSTRFPPSVQCKRGVSLPDCDPKKGTNQLCGQDVTSSCVAQIVFLIALLLILLFAVVYIPVYLAVTGDPKIRDPGAAQAGIN